MVILKLGVTTYAYYVKALTDLADFFKNRSSSFIDIMDVTGLRVYICFTAFK